MREDNADLPDVSDAVQVAPRPRHLALTLCCAALTACGTTVPLTSQQSVTGGAGLGNPSGALGSTSAPLSVPDGVPPTGAGGTGGAASGGGSGSGATGTGPGSTTGTGAVAQPGPAPSTTNGGAYGQGITATTVKVGFAYDPNQDATNATVVQGVSAGNVKALNQAYADMLNARGGLAGKKVVLDAYAVNTQAPNYSAELDAACKHFTTDAKDFSVLTGGDPRLITCLEKGGVLAIETNLTISGEDDFRKAPHYFEPATLALERRARNLPQALADQGWFGSSSKVGVLSYDTPGFRGAVEKELLPRLSALGHPAAPEDVQLVAYPASYGEYGGLASAISSAVLKFQQDGVTHVVVLDAKGVATLFLMSNAESQQWHPKYGLDSASGVQTLYEGGNISASQASQATGIGWLPTLDVPSDKVPPNPTSKACLAFFAGKGFAASDNNARAVQLAICDTFSALERSLLGGARDRGAAARALEAVGSDFRAATAIQTGFGPDRHDGVTAYRFLTWNAECGCMNYVGGDRPAR